MGTIFISLLCVSVLVLMVLGLHQHQLRKTKDNVDKNLPLPPLNYSFTESANKDEVPIDINEPSISKTGWAERATQYKNEGDLESAFQQSTTGYPLWTAFSQAATVLRAKIRQDLKNNCDVSENLKKLYHVAAIASFFHDKIPDLGNLPASRLKELNIEPWEHLPMAYDKIGYTELRLLKKNDIKLILKKWGKPTQHCSAKKHHEKVWMELISIDS